MEVYVFECMYVLYANDRFAQEGSCVNEIWLQLHLEMSASMVQLCSVEDVPVGWVANGVEGRDGRRVGGASWSPNAQQAGLGVSTVPGLAG